MSMRVGDAAVQADVNRQTVRFYARLRLIDGTVRVDRLASSARLRSHMEGHS